MTTQTNLPEGDSYDRDDCCAARGGCQDLARGTGQATGAGKGRRPRIGCHRGGDAAPNTGFAVNVFLRGSGSAGDTVYRTWHTNGRGTEQLSHTFGLIDILPWGRQENWQDSPEGWPKMATYSSWLGSEDIVRRYGRSAPTIA